jgi:type IV secretion system protein VirB9
MKRLALMLLGIETVALGQVPQGSIATDARFAIMTHHPNIPIRVQASPTSVVNLMFDPKERVQQVTVGDSGAYQVTVPSSADAIFVRSLRPGTSTTMSVRTDRQNYEFFLDSNAGEQAPYVVQIRSGDQQVAKVSPPTALPPTFAGPGRYKVSGDRSLKPVTVSDDGLRTYIQWSPSQPMPAVFGVSSDGNEEMVDGFMRSGTFTIDRVFERLVFRLDKVKTSATRLAVKAAK